MGKATAIAVGALTLLLLTAALNDGVAQTVTAAAIWRPPAGFMSRFHARCDWVRGDEFSACFAAEMAKAGASPAALDLTGRLGNEAYLEALTPTGGPVAVARVFYPFRANENDTWLLVNATPPLIDVDDQQYLALAQLRSSRVYKEIWRHYPNVAFWPGARGSARPKVAQNGREIIICCATSVTPAPLWAGYAMPSFLPRMEASLELGCCRSPRSRDKAALFLPPIRSRPRL